MFKKEPKDYKDICIKIISFFLYSGAIFIILLSLYATVKILKLLF